MVISGNLLLSALFFLPITASAAPLYDVDDNGNVVIDSVIDEDTGEVTQLPEPVTDDSQFEEAMDNGTVDSDALSSPVSEEDQISAEEDTLEAQEASDPNDLLVDAPTAVLYAASAASVGDFDPDNCIIYSASYSSYTGYLLIPASYYEQIYVDENGVIWNVGNGSVSCRFVSSLSVSDSDYAMRAVTLYSVVQDNASTVYNYGSLTRVRTYYQSSSRLTYTDYWGPITTDSDLSNLSRNSVVSLRLGIYMILAVFLIGGFLCYRKH